MGQHKYNPLSIKAKNGELPQKPKKKSKKEQERLKAKLMYDLYFVEEDIDENYSNY